MLKNKNYTTKKWAIILAIVILIFLSIFGIYKYKEYATWQAPYFNSNKNIHLYNAKVDRLNDRQEEAFYSIARGAIKAKNPDLDFSNIEDDSLYVDKIKGKHNYYINYVCSSPVLKLKFTTDVTINLNKSSLKDDTPFKIKSYKSTLPDVSDDETDF